MSPRGWCPGVFTPMAAADGLLVRVKPRRSRLEAAMARRVAESVAAHGNGRIELTSRANLQIRGLTESGSVAFAREMAACGAADPDPAVERRRNVILSPLAGDDPSILGRPDAVAAGLEAALAAAAGLHLPAKFGFAVDGGGLLMLGDVAADVVLETCEAGCRVRIAGATMQIVCAETDAPDVAMALARAFLRLGGDRRMRDLVAALGEQAVYAAAGVHATMQVAAQPQVGQWGTGFSAGMVLYPTVSRCAVGVAPPRGLLDPSALTQAAAFSGMFGDGWVRVSPWRGLLIGGVRREHATRGLALAA